MQIARVVIVRVIVDGVLGVIVDVVLGVIVDVHIGHDEVLVIVVIYVAIFVVIFWNWRCTLYKKFIHYFQRPESRRQHSWRMDPRTRVTSVRTGSIKKCRGQHE